VITNEQREFIAQLTAQQLNDLTRRMRIHASRELRRNGLIKGHQTPSDVVSTAYERLLDDANRCWPDDPPTLEGLGVFLMRRVEDVVTKLRRRATRAGPCKEFDSQTDMEVLDFAENRVGLKEVEDAWLESAMTHSDDTARVVMEYLTGNTLPEGQEEKLELDRKTIYRHRSKAMDLLRAVLKQREIEQ
jgi:hypothetical protein